MKPIPFRLMFHLKYYIVVFQTEYQTLKTPYRLMSRLKYYIVVYSREGMGGLFYSILFYSIAKTIQLYLTRLTTLFRA
jgi:hypothetical protein